MENQSEVPEIEARTRRLPVYNSEKPVLEKENMPPTGIRDEIEPADKTVESMAQAAVVSRQDDEAEEDDDDTVSVSPSMTSTTTATGKKKKKKSKSKSKRGIGKPTGFEEYFVDGPLTPAQHAQDVEDFSPDLPFIDRILRAVQRFEQSKRMESQRRDIFYKYLAYGGIDVGPNMFQGAIDAEGLDKDSISIALAQTSIGKDKFIDNNTPEAKYAVDFSGCVSGFLSRRAMFYYGFETPQLVELVTSVLEKFMNYLLHHNVCPEYEADIRSARKIIQKATNELYSMAQISKWLPGDFNRAASTLFGGTYATKYDGISSWDPEENDVELPQASFIGFTPEVAHQIFGLAIATVGTEKQYEDFIAPGPISKNPAYEVVEIKERAGFEITDLVAVTEQNLAFYKQHSKEYRPVGIMHARPWRNKASEGLQDLTAAEREAETQMSSDPLASPSWISTETHTFFVEGAAQQFLFVGMKLEATIHKLRCGIWFMDDFLQAFCSFDMWLCNELMLGWKEPRIKKGAVCWRGEGMGDEDLGEDLGEDGNVEEGKKRDADAEIKAVSGAAPESIVNGTAE